MPRTDAYTSNGFFRLHEEAEEAAVDLARELDMLACDESGDYAIRGTSITEVRESAARLASTLRAASMAAPRWARGYAVAQRYDYPPGLTDGVQIACWDARVTLLQLIRALRSESADKPRRAAVMAGAMVRLIWQVRDARGAMHRAIEDLDRQGKRARREAAHSAR